MNKIFFTEKHLRYIQRTLKVSRQEVIDTIRHSHISAQQIADNIKKVRQRFQSGDITSDTCRYGVING